MLEIVVTEIPFGKGPTKYGCIFKYGFSKLWEIKRKGALIT
jgi:hypothetical protein